MLQTSLSFLPVHRWATLCKHWCSGSLSRQVLHSLLTHRRSSFQPCGTTAGSVRATTLNVPLHAYFLRHSLVPHIWKHHRSDGSKDKCTGGWDAGRGPGSDDGFTFGNELAYHVTGDAPTLCETYDEAPGPIKAEGVRWQWLDDSRR